MRNSTRWACGRRLLRCPSRLPWLGPMPAALAMLSVLSMPAGCGYDPGSIALGSGEGVSPSTSGELVISEIFYDPSPTVDTEGEWVELYYPGPGPILNLKGCLLEDLGTDSHTIQLDTAVYPNSYVTLAVTSYPGFLPDYTYSSFTLGNAGDEVRLTCGGTVIDLVDYNAGFPLATQASMTLQPGFLDATSNDAGGNWCAATTPTYTDQDGVTAFGTPGSSNVC